MKKNILALFLLLIALQAGAQENRVSIVLFDDSIAKLEGLPYPTEYDQALAVLPEIGGEPNIFMSPEQVTQLNQMTRYIHVPRPPGMSYGEAHSMGVASGLIASVIIEAKVHSDRQKTIQPIRDVLNKALLKERVLGSVRETLSSNGYPVKESYVAERIGELTIENALKKSGASHAFVIGKLAAPIVSISSDNQKPMLSAHVAHYEELDGRIRKSYEMRVVFIGHPALEEAKSDQYWSENQGERFLAEVKTGFEKILRHAIETGPGMPSEKEMREKAKLSRKNPDLTIEMLKSDADFAYGFVESRYYLILPVQKHAELASIKKTTLFDARADMKLSPFQAASPDTKVSEMPVAGTATVRFTGINDSEAETMLRRFSISAHSSDDCNKKSALKLGVKTLNPKKEEKFTSDIFTLNAGSRVYLNLGYIDARFAQNRICTSTVSFIPMPNEDYHLEFIVDRTVSRCDGRVLGTNADGTKFSAEFSIPPLVCGGEQKNGVSSWNNF